MNNRSLLLEQEIVQITKEEDLQQKKARLELAVNDLINNDFNQLMQLLYRLDIDENKIRRALDANRGADTAPLITNLIIERQAEKIKSRRQFKQRDDSISDEERW